MFIIQNSPDIPIPNLRVGVSVFVLVVVANAYSFNELISMPLYWLTFSYEIGSHRMYVCMVTHIARVWINRVRLPMLHVVS